MIMSNNWVDRRVVTLLYIKVSMGKVCLYYLFGTNQETGIHWFHKVLYIIYNKQLFKNYNSEQVIRHYNLSKFVDMGYEMQIQAD